MEAKVQTTVKLQYKLSTQVLAFLHQQRPQVSLVMSQHPQGMAITAFEIAH